MRLIGVDHDLQTVFEVQRKLYCINYSPNSAICDKNALPSDVI